MGDCLSSTTIQGMSYTQAVINAISDWIYGLLPIALLWNANMNKRSKVSVGILLALGSM